MTIVWKMGGKIVRTFLCYRTFSVPRFLILISFYFRRLPEWSRAIGLFRRACVSWTVGMQFIIKFEGQGRKFKVAEEEQELRSYWDGQLWHSEKPAEPSAKRADKKET